MVEIGGLVGNQFVGGGLVLMVTGAAMALLRQLPIRVWAWVKSQFVVSLNVLDTDPIFEWLKLWLDEQEYTKRTRRLAVSTLKEVDGEGLGRVIFSPAPGNHVFWYRGRLVWLNRDRQNQAPTTGSAGARGFTMESMNVTVMGRSQEILRQLVEDARRTVEEYQREKVSVYVSTYGWWRKMSGCRLRPYSSVILPAGEAERVMEDVLQFLGSRKEYIEVSVPYHRGYLLYGIPGTGKTSLVAALASELRLNLYVLSLAGEGMNDERLNDLITSVQPRSVILFEDIDAVVKSRDIVKVSDAPAALPNGESGKGVTLSGLLNCLDGVVAREGCLIFMTTNHVDRLDPALIRAGRIDVRLEFRYATTEQAMRAYRRFFPWADEDEALEFAAQFAGREVTMAEVQEELVQARFGKREVAVA